MKIIESKAELLLQPNGLEGVYKQIELCGRTCYKSTDKITDGSAKPFVDRMIASKHTAMLEQGTVYLKIPYNLLHRLTHIGLCKKYVNNPYSRVQEFYEYIDHPMPNGDDLTCNIIPYLAVTTNLRVLVENGWLDDLEYICEPTDYHEKRYTMRFTTDRGVSHELVRHRVFSFAQESTRYCNYSKEKFGNELTFIIPTWANNRDEISYVHDPHNLDERDMLKEDFGASYGGFLHQLCLIEDEYLWQLQQGRTPQEARQILPNALKTEVCMTGFASDWKFFFDLRFYGMTGKPHPDMEVLASKAREEFIKAGKWDEIYSSPSKFREEMDK